MLTNKIKICDLKNFQNIIIYVSCNDASQSRDLEYVEEKYEQMINYIKSKNPTMIIYMCSVCSQGDTSVTEISELIQRQSYLHGAMYIDTNRNLYNKQKQLKPHFFKPRDNIHLSSSGTKGLLGAVSQHKGIVSNTVPMDLPKEMEGFNPQDMHTAMEGFQYNKRKACLMPSHIRTRYDAMSANCLVIKILFVGYFRTGANKPQAYLRTNDFISFS